MLLPQQAGRAVSQAVSSSVSRNQLILALSPSDLALIGPDLVRVTLEMRQVLERPNRPVEAIYFMEEGITSVVALSKSRKRIEAGIIGREGMSGLPALMGDGMSPNETYIQIPGGGMRIGAGPMRAAMQASTTLRALVLHYAQVFLVQTAQTALANGQAKLEERLARWLLMAHDRVDGDDLPLIHEFLALMLGVRRAGVTVALQSLESQGLVRAERGLIVVVDRDGLEDVADGSYGIPEAEYRRLIG